MSMTYYAVTDDPNELAHYGVLGMKWGVTHDKPRHSGSRSRKPRSAAYKKAQSKLGKMMKSGIKKAEAHWKEYNSPKAKEARFMKKAMQQARTGTLKYGKLTDEQVRKVTDRLALERNARQLGSTENPRMMKRLKTAVGTGIVEGIGRGTASYINARFEGRGRTTAEIKRDKRMAKYEADNNTRKLKNKQAIAEEYYKVATEEGDSPRYKSAAKRAKYLAEVKKRNKQNDYNASIQRIYDEQDARSRAVSDRQRSDWRRNALLNEINSGSRKLQSSGAVKRLNDFNERHENYNTYKDQQLARIEGGWQKRVAANNKAAERKFATNQVMQEYAKTQRQRAQESAIRENAARQKELARQARQEEITQKRLAVDYKNTSNRRKRKGRR